MKKDYKEEVCIYAKRYDKMKAKFLNFSSDTYYKSEQGESAMIKKS